MGSSVGELRVVAVAPVDPSAGRDSNAVDPGATRRVSSAMRAQLESSFALLQVLDLPESVRDLIAETNAYVIALAERPTPEISEQWPSLRERLLRVGDRL
jgi:hypothetical protein